MTNMVPYKTLIKILRLYNGISSTIKKPITAQKKKNIYKWLLLSLYLGDGDAHPPRRSKDYYLMKIIQPFKNDTMEDINKKISNDFNYLVLKNRFIKPRFIFNNYKTVNKYGRQDVPLSRKMNSKMNKYMRYGVHSEWLLPAFTDPKKHIAPNTFTSFISHIFKDTIGKNISTQLIRTIYDTHKYKDNVPILEAEKTAKLMGHSIGTAQKHYVKH